MGADSRELPITIAVIGPPFEVLTITRHAEENRAIGIASQETLPDFRQA
jgi:hypothetical protein